MQPLSALLRTWPATAALSCVVGIVACASPPPPAPVPAPHHPVWGYTGATGPEHWAELDASFAMCSHGTRQSPIDLRPRDSVPGSTLVSPHWDPVPLTIGNNGHTVQVDDAAPSSLVVDGVSYSLVQFHFHAPSEHTLEGRAFDAEMHLVHRSPDGKLAVIALFFQKGAENAALRPVFDAIPTEPGPPQGVRGKTIDVAALLPRAARYLSYDGSLTTPPCSEGVRWLLVLPDPALELAEPDLAKLRAAVHAPNNRPAQPGNERALQLRGP
jgi:carbonic anhydrase